MVTKVDPKWGLKLGLLMYFFSPNPAQVSYDGQAPSTAGIGSVSNPSPDRY